MNEYLVNCWNCAGEYDALSAVWCNCDPRNPTKLCPYCMHCFCSATKEYLLGFWNNAPQELVEEMNSLNSSTGQLGQILVAGGLITVPQLIRGMALSKAEGKRLGEALVALGFVTVPQIDRALEKQGGRQAQQTGSSPTDQSIAAPAEPATPPVAAAAADPHAAAASFAKAPSPAALSASSPDLVKDALNNILLVALKKQASALYLERDAAEVVVRARIDGVLFKLKTLPIEWMPSIVERLKRLAKLNPGESRLPQSGRMSLRTGEKSYDLIVQTLPSAQGESVGMRIIDRDSLAQDLARLGLEESDYAKLVRAVEGTYGIIVLSGPMFNSVTETAYSILHHLVLKNRKVVSLESPVTSSLSGVNQLEIQETQGFDFVQGLKTVLNLSPDVIFLSNIPDGETLRLAARIASGVQVIALMDCPTTFQVFDRIRSFSVNLAQPMAAMQLVMSQRVIRRNCPHCIERKPITQSLAAEMGHSNDEIHLTPEVGRGRGCSHCNDLGYSGRKLLFETLAVDDEIRALVLEGGGQEALERSSQKQGFTSLRLLHLKEVARLASSPEEFIRCAYPRPILKRIYRVK